MSSNPYREKERGAIAWMTGNPVAANLIMMFLIVGGIATLMTIKQEVFPEFALDVVTVSVTNPGSSPDEVEKSIIKVIEENVKDVDGIGEVTSTAVEGSGSVNIEIVDTDSSQRIYQDIQQEVNRIISFPEEAEKPQVTLASIKREVLNIVLYGDIPEDILREQAEEIRNQLLLDSEISQVELSGIKDHEITINVPRENLIKYNLTIRDIAQRINALATEIPGGGIKTASGEILVRVTERKDYASEFENLPIITQNDGTIVYLKEIATCTDGFKEVDSFGQFNGLPSIGIDVFRVGTQTPISIANAGKSVIEKINKKLPPTLRLAINKDRSKIYEQRRNLLIKNGSIGLFLVLCILGLFLEIKLAFWVMMGIPISFMGGLIFIPMFDISISMISMFAFLITLGIVVDDAIVVGENIYEHRQRHDTGFHSSVAGSKEVAIPVTFSVLTNVVTFMPMLFIPGFMGKIWFCIPVVVSLVFLISLFESIFILPAHLAHVSKVSKNYLFQKIHNIQQRFSQWFMKTVKRRYGPFLDLLLRNRYIVIALSISIFIGTIGYVISGRIGMQLMEKVDSDFSYVTVALPYGSPISDTQKVGKQLIAAAERVSDRLEEKHDCEVSTGVFSRYGRYFRGTSGSHNVSVKVYMVEADIRTISTTDFTDEWRKETGDIIGAEAVLFESDRGGPGHGASFSLDLLHEDSKILDLASAELAAELAKFPIVSDIDDGFSPGKVQFDYTMRPEGTALGLTSQEVAIQIRAAFYGIEALSQQRGRNEVDIQVKLPKSQRASLYDLNELLIKTPTGRDVPLRDVAIQKLGRAYTKISRRNGKKIVTISANVTPPGESENIMKKVTSDIIPRLQNKYSGLGYSLSGKQQDMQEGMSALFIGFIMALLGVFFLLAIPFRSYSQPLIIMTSIPFGIVGAIWAHVLMGYDLSIISFMGIVALTGVVVNDSLVLIDFANGERRSGLSVHDSIHSAGIRRFRPIILTTMTTFLGLAPMIFEPSRQARFMIPMAISLGFGIVFSTLITLILVPCLYIVIEDIKAFYAAILGKKTETKSIYKAIESE